MALQLRQGGIGGHRVYDDDTLDCALDPQIGFDLGSLPGQVCTTTFNPVKIKVFFKS